MHFRLNDGNGGDPIVSIVMPVYNQETVLRDTLQSVLGQDLESFELICVNDGSTDATAEILGEAAKDDGRVTVLTLPGLGAAQARNHGLEHARGKYVQFLDSDDLFHPSMLSEMVAALERTQSELCACEADRFNHVTGEVEPHIRFPKRWREDCYEHGAFGRETFRLAKNYPWNKMVLRELLLREGIRFQNLHNSNDTYFSTLSVWKAKRVYLLHAPLINYRWALGTSIQDARTKHPTCPLQVGEAVYADIASECTDAEAREGLILFCVRHGVATMQRAMVGEAYTPELHDRIVDDFRKWNVHNEHRCLRSDLSLWLPTMLLLTADYDSVKRAYSKMTDERGRGSTRLRKAQLAIRIVHEIAASKIFAYTSLRT